MHDSGFTVTGYDLAESNQHFPFVTHTTDMSDAKVLNTIFIDIDAVLSCLPFQLNVGVATAARAAGIHYFDLTEDVQTTKTILKISESSNGLMAPQCGLAPGFVGIVGASQVAEFNRCRSCRMRVGALPQNPTGLMGYAFN